MSGPIKYQKEAYLGGYSLVIMVIICLIQPSSTQSNCLRSSSLSHIQTGTISSKKGSLTLAFASIHAGINTYNQQSLLISELIQNNPSYNSSQLQVVHSLSNFSTNQLGYEMNRFLVSVSIYRGMVRFVVIWAEFSNTQVNVAININFMIVYQREEFLLGNFIADTTTMMSNSVSNTLNVNQTIPFHEYSNLTSTPKSDDEIFVQVFIVGIQYNSTHPNISLSSAVYNLSSSSLSVSITQSTSPKQLLLIHISYLIFSKTFISKSYYIYTSLKQIPVGQQVDYSFVGKSQFNPHDTQDFNQYNQLYFHYFSRYQCKGTGCQGCTTLDTCKQINGIILNNNICAACNTTAKWNAATNNCQNIVCPSGQIWNLTTCACINGLLRIGTVCWQCPYATIYNSSSLSCVAICKQNQTFSLSKCICSSGYYLISGACSQCLSTQSYNSTTQKCISLTTCPSKQSYNPITKKCICTSPYVMVNSKCIVCSKNTVYNSLNQTCVCKSGYLLIAGFCGYCPKGTTYNVAVQRCDLICKTNQAFINGTCVCNGSYVNGICKKCPSNTTYNNTTATCQPVCGQNQYYSRVYQSCSCEQKFFIINNACSTCPANTTYDYSSQSCTPIKTCLLANQVLFNGLCICNVGYFRIQNICGVCYAGTNYNDVTMSCLSICQNSQVYNNITKLCDCNQNLGYYLVNGNCSYCKVGTIYNHTFQTCVNICPAGTEFNITTKNCKNKCTNGTVYNISTNTCISICPSGTQFNITSQTCVNICPSTQLFINGNCSCQTGLYYINNICGTCDISFVYNSTSFSCVPICTDPNSYYKNGVCFCLAPFYISFQLKCLQCPVNTTYNVQTLNCSPNSIPNPILNCNITSEKKTYNQTSGTYYCACSVADGYYLIFNYCGICPTFTKYNPLTLSCELDFTGLLSATNPNKIPILKNNATTRNLAQSNIYSDTTNQCRQNQVWDGAQCVCLDLFYRISGVCTLCPAYSLFNGTGCICQINYFTQYIDINYLPVCTKCHRSCLTCLNSSSSSCLTCANIYLTPTFGVCSLIRRN